MRQRRKLPWNRKENKRKVLRCLSICLIFMIASQGLIIFNEKQVHWMEERVSDVSTEADSSLIVAVDAGTGKAGAVDYKGNVIIPFESSIFNPWDGSIIDGGMLRLGPLFWIMKDNRVTVVNDKNEPVIDGNYGYLQKTIEDQFIAGQGKIANSVTGGGVYTYKKYGVITEQSEVVIPIEYDELQLIDNEKYQGVIKEEARIITRTFYSNGNLEKESVEEIETELAQNPEEIDNSEESEPVHEDEHNDSSIESNASDGDDAGEPEGTVDNEEGTDNIDGESAGEQTEIQDYDGPIQDYEYINRYVDGENMKLHLEGAVCKLEDEYGNVLVTFEGDRVEETMPIFSNENQLVIDERENMYQIYNANTGSLLCETKSAADCIISQSLLAYDQGTEYVVKNFSNTEIFRIHKGPDDEFMNSKNEKARFIFQMDYFIYQGDEGRTLITNKGVVIAEGLESIAYNNENREKEEETDQIFICEKNGKYGAYTAGGNKILDFLYKNIEFFNGHEEGLKITDTNGNVGIVNYKGQIIIPIEYDNVGYGSRIVDADSSSATTYTILDNESNDNRYFAQKGRNIYYLNDEGERQEEVRYIKESEKGKNVSDFLSLRELSENPLEYRATGDVLIMDNAYSLSPVFHRSEVVTKLDRNKITFLLIDGSSERLGIYEYYYGDFSLMGYQHWFWVLWMLSSRAAVLFILVFLCMVIPVENISDSFYFFRQHLKREFQRKGYKNGKKTGESHRRIPGFSKTKGRE